jgi:hypothetical protein
MKTTVTKENQEGVREFYHKTIMNSDKKTPARCRRNGKTQTWKTRPLEFKIPVKHRLYDFFYITHLNCNEWTID